jgi:DNA polymerase-3 subunit epsilon
MTLPLVVFDLETTDRDPHEARIVQAYLGLLDASGALVKEQEWIVNPGVTLSDEVVEIHGITNERVQAEGHHPAEVLEQIIAIIRAEVYENHLPLAGQNLAYDLTVLSAEVQRHCPRPEPLRFDSIPILDSLVIDRAIDKYRKGSRKLIDMARHYGVPITEDEAHSASFDAVAAGRIIQRQLADRQRLARQGVYNLEALDMRMPLWAQEQADSYAEWRRSPKAGDQQDPTFRAERGWPVRERTAA